MPTGNDIELVVQTGMCSVQNLNKWDTMHQFSDAKPVSGRASQLLFSVSPGRSSKTNSEAYSVNPSVVWVSTDFIWKFWAQHPCRGESYVSLKATLLVLSRFNGLMSVQAFTSFVCHFHRPVQQPLRIFTYLEWWLWIRTEEWFVFSLLLKFPVVHSCLNHSDI